MPSTDIFAYEYVYVCVALHALWTYCRCNVCKKKCACIVDRNIFTEILMKPYISRVFSQDYFDVTYVLKGTVVINNQISFS